MVNEGEASSKMNRYVDRWIKKEWMNKRTNGWLATMNEWALKKLMKEGFNKKEETFYKQCIRTVFNWVLKVISELLWFFITSLSDWFNLAPLFNQSKVKPEPATARAWTFSRALCRLTSRFDWFTGLPPSFFIGQKNYFGFGFTTLDWNSL